MVQKNYSLDKIIYISIPENFSTKIGKFKIDTSILLPVENINSETYDISDLSWEMIIAGMLKVIGYDPNHEHIDYYKNFVKAVKPDIYKELSESGIIKAKNGDYEIAEELFLILSNLYPDSIEWILNLALVYEEHAETYEKLEKSDYCELYTQKAFDIYKTAYDKYPKNPDLNFNMGYFFLKNNNLEKTYTHFNNFIETSKDKEKKEKIKNILSKINTDSLKNTQFQEAYDFIKIGKEKEGIEKVQELLKTNSDIWNGWFLLGWGYRRIGEYQKGCDAFYKALSLNENQIDIYNELSICLMELNNFDESFKYLEKALALEPDNVKIISNLGILSLKQGHKEESETFFKTVLELAPEDPIALKYIEFLNEE